jgi:hypothetical protein
MKAQSSEVCYTRLVLALADDEKKALIRICRKEREALGYDVDAKEIAREILEALGEQV